MDSGKRYEFAAPALTLRLCCTICNVSFQFIPNSFAYIFSLVFAIRHRSMALDILTTFAICDDKLRSLFGISFSMPNVKMRRVAILACVGK